MLWGNTKLQTITIQSFFPDPKTGNKYQCSYGNPYDSVKLIKKMKDSGKPIRLLITETDINMEVLIDNFEYGMSSGTDVHYSITMTEYRKIHIPKVADNNNLTVAPTNPPRPNPSPSKPDSNNNGERRHTVKGNDTLWGIAKMYYGNGSQWGKIWDRNKPMRSGNPNLIYTGEVVIIP